MTYESPRDPRVRRCGDPALAGGLRPKQHDQRGERHHERWSIAADGDSGPVSSASPAAPNTEPRD
jgi:hypothetical protein